MYRKAEPLTKINFANDTGVHTGFDDTDHDRVVELCLQWCNIITVFLSGHFFFLIEAIFIGIILSGCLEQ